MQKVNCYTHSLLKFHQDYEDTIRERYEEEENTDSE